MLPYLRYGTVGTVPTADLAQHMEVDGERKSGLDVRVEYATVLLRRLSYAPPIAFLM